MHLRGGDKLVVKYTDHLSISDVHRFYDCKLFRYVLEICIWINFREKKLTTNNGTPIFHSTSSFDEIRFPVI